MADQRLPTVDSDDGVWGEILNQFLEKEHYNTGTNNAANGGHKTITIRPGTATAGTAPLKFTSGTLLSSPEAGAMEFLSDSLYFTITTGAVRKTLAMYDDSSGATGDIYYRDSSGNFTRLAIGSPGDVLKVNSGLPSWGTVSASAGGSSGQIQYNNGGALGGTAGFTYQSGASPNVTIQAQNAAHVPLAVRGAGSQTANLQEWQNSTPTTLTSVTKDGYVNAPLGAAGTPSFSFIDDPDTGMFGAGSDSLQFATGGTSRLVISSLGNTVPGSDNAYTLGSVLARWSQVISMIYRAANQTAGTPAYSFNNDSNSGLYLVSDDVHGYSIGGSQKLNIDTNGLAVLSGAFRLDNANFLQWKDSGGSYRNILSYNGSNHLSILTDSSGGNDIIFSPRGSEFARFDQSDNALALETGIYLKFGGAGGDTNLYRSAENTLKTDDGLEVVGHGAVGANSALATDTVFKITETYTSNSGSLTGINTAITTDPTGASTASVTGGVFAAKTASGDTNGAFALIGSQGRSDHSSEGTVSVAYGTAGYVGATGSAGAITTAIGTMGQVDNFTDETFTTALGVLGQVKNGSTGTITTAVGVFGQVASEGGGTLAAATAITAQNSLTGTGNITESFGVQVANPTETGAGSISTNIGIYVHPMSAGGTNYGVSIGAAGTQTLVIGSNADNTTASAGLAFGSSRDTNLYRSAASTLATDDDFNIKGGKALKIDGGTSGTVTVQTAATAGTWTLTLPTDDGESGQMLKTNGSGVTSWGDVTFNTSTKTADYTVATSDTVILADATSGNVTITMPAASGASGYRFFIKRIDNSSNTVNVARAGSDTIDGQTSQSIAQQYTSLTLVSNGSNWFII